jgi:hypothetical protein
LTIVSLQNPLKYKTVIALKKIGFQNEEFNMLKMDHVILYLNQWLDRAKDES